MRAKVNEIPPREEATWGAVLASLLRTHPREMTYHWNVYDKGGPGEFSVIEIHDSGEDVAELRAEIEAVVDLVNSVVERDPLKMMVPADMGLVEVLVD